jgi:hypothetical protein
LGAPRVSSIKRSRAAKLRCTPAVGAHLCAYWCLVPSTGAKIRELRYAVAAPVGSEVIRHSTRQSFGKQPVVLLFHHQIALATAFFHSHSIEYRNVAARVAVSSNAFGRRKSMIDQITERYHQPEGARSCTLDSPRPDGYVPHRHVGPSIGKIHSRSARGPPLAIATGGPAVAGTATGALASAIPRRAVDRRARNDINRGATTIAEGLDRDSEVDSRNDDRK